MEGGGASASRSSHTGSMTRHWREAPSSLLRGTPSPHCLRSATTRWPLSTGGMQAAQVLATTQSQGQPVQEPLRNVCRGPVLWAGSEHSVVPAQREGPQGDRGGGRQFHVPAKKGKEHFRRSSSIITGANTPPLQTHSQELAAGLEEASAPTLTAGPFTRAQR